MKNKLISLIIFLFAVIALNSAWTFPDNILDYQNIFDYQLTTLKFGKTRINEFTKLVKSQPQKKVQDYDIFVTNPTESDVYNKIRTGFRKDKLDWIEFTLSNRVEISKFIELYGKPRNINTSYSQTLDYYDYGFFNVSTDKKHEMAKNITLFSLSIQHDSLESNLDLGEKIPEWQYLNKVNFLNLKPGATFESDFNDLYPNLKPNQSNNNLTTTYILDRELGKAKSQYKNVILNFENGLLNWISISLQDLSLDNALKVYGTNYKIEKINNDYDIYNFPNFSLVVNKKQKKVINIGLTNPEN